jgi:hypothetical protein
MTSSLVKAVMFGGGNCPQRNYPTNLIAQYDARYNNPTIPPFIHPAEFTLPEQQLNYSFEGIRHRPSEIHRNNHVFEQQVPSTQNPQMHSRYMDSGINSSQSSNGNVNIPSNNGQTQLANCSREELIARLQKLERG